MNETAIQKFDYEGNAIAFANGENVMVNATQMARKFGKRPQNWLKTQQAKEFLDEMSKALKRALPDLVQVTNGGKKDEHGTWMHEDVALEFARWLSPKFAIWCNARIKELVRTGFTTAAPQPEARSNEDILADALRILQGRVEERDQRIEQLEDKLTRLHHIISPTVPSVTYTFTEVAHALGFEVVTDFLNWAVESGILARVNGRCVPSDRYADRGFFWHRNGRGYTNPNESRTYTVVTEAGLAMFADELAAYNAEEGGAL